MDLTLDLSEGAETSVVMWGFEANLAAVDDRPSRWVFEGSNDGAEHEVLTSTEVWDGQNARSVWGPSSAFP